MSDFVTFEIAKKLKEKGFIGNRNIGCCCGFYCEEGFNINIVYDDLDNNELLHNEYLRPTIAQTLKWIRETKKIYIDSAYMPKIIHQGGIANDFYYPTFQKIGLYEPMFFIGGDDNYDTYEKSMLAGIEFILDKWEKY